MAFTPYSTPIQYEYKPLNLAAFAVPLGKMQEQLDLTKAAVSSTDFDLAHLPYGSDPERAKELIETARAKRDELAKNLMETKNYRQAAIKLAELNKTWKSDPEKLALESNYKLWQERDKAERERIDSGKDDQISREDYLQWRADEIRKYEAATEEGKTGAAFKASWEKPEGDYRTITGQTGRLSNLADELQELSFKVAQAVEGDERESALSMIGIDPTTMDAHFRKTIIEERDANKVASAVRNYLMTAPNSKYKDWAEESARYTHKDMLYSGNYGQYANQIVGNALTDNAQSIKQREEYLRKNKGKKEEDPVYANLLERKNVLSNMQATGEYDPKIVEKLYTAQHVSDVFDFDALGKVFEYKKIGTEDVFRDIPQDTSGGTGGTEDIGVGPIVTPLTEETFSIPNLNQQKTQAAGGLYKSIQDIRKIGGGAMGGLILGATQQEREKMAKNPAKAFDNANIVMIAYQKAAKATGNKFEVFKSTLRARGLQFDGGQAWTTFQELNKPNSTAIANLSTALQEGERSYTDYTVADDNLKVIEKSIKKDLGNAASVLEDKNVEMLNEETGDIETFSYGEIAQLHGYKNLQDAINKGFNFRTISKDKYGYIGNEIADNILKIKNDIIQKKNVKAEMSYGFINDKQTGDVLGQMFRSSTDLENYVPAYQGNWKGMPGFTEDGKIAPGTSIEISKRVPPIIVQHGNKMFYNVAIDYKDENGNVTSKTITLTPKAGSQYLNDAFLNHMDERTSNNPGVDAQTKDHIKILKYNNKFPNNLSPQTFDNIETSKGQDAILQSIVYGNNGETIDIVKEQNIKYGDQKPVMRIYISNANGQRDPKPLDNPETGKPFYSDDPNAVKAFLARQMKL